MRFTGKYVGIKLDLSRYQQQLENYLVQSLHHGARAWLQAVAGRGGRVPLWSGMARASLLELSELINGTVVLSPLRVKSRIPKGRALGTAVQEISPEKVQLTIETDVPHYNLQEYRRAAKGGSPRAPWLSLKVGAIAWKIATLGVKLPKPIFKPFNMEIK